MSRPRRIGVSNGRFSDPKQGKGDSEDRQERMYRDFCQRHNLTPLTEVFLDRGRSGYRDEHRKKGRLGVLIAYAKDGRFEPGTVIVIEAWDRLGRLRPDKQTELVAELLRTGVDIGVCGLNDLFTEDDFGTHKWTTLAVFIQLAYQESKQKAERISASWESRRKRARADGTLVTGRLPAWLEMNGDGACRPVPERVAAVKRIFALACEGFGRSRIASALIAEGVPSFGTGKVWTRSYINRILVDRRVRGEYQPRKTDDSPDGQPIPDYYPAVVSEKEWLLSRAGQEQRRGKDRLGRDLVRSERKHVNLFRGLLVHALDGEGFFLNEKVEGDKRRSILRNFAAQSGRGKTVTFPYLPFENAILERLKEVDVAAVLPKGDKGEQASKADVLRVKLANIRQDIGHIKADLKTAYSKALSAVVREKELEEEAAAGQLQEELGRSVRPAEKAWEDLPSLVDLVRDGGDEERLKLRPVLRRVVETMLVLIVRRGSYLLAAVQIFFHDGQHRYYLIVNQSAGYNRKGGCWPGSFPAEFAPDDIDLRTESGVKKMQKALETVPIPK